MSTLLFPEPRASHAFDGEDVISFLKEAQEVANHTRAELSEVFRAYELLETRRRNQLKSDDGDQFDVVMAGFGQLLQDLVNKVDYIATRMEER